MSQYIVEINYPDKQKPVYLGPYSLTKAADVALENYKLKTKIIPLAS